MWPRGQSLQGRQGGVSPSGLQRECGRQRPGFGLLDLRPSLLPPELRENQALLLVVPPVVAQDPGRGHSPAACRAARWVPRFAPTQTPLWLNVWEKQPDCSHNVTLVLSLAQSLARFPWASLPGRAVERALWPGLH